MLTDSKGKKRRGGGTEAFFEKRAKTEAKGIVNLQEEQPPPRFCRAYVSVSRNAGSTHVQRHKPCVSTQGAGGALQVCSRAADAGEMPRNVCTSRHSREHGKRMVAIFIAARRAFRPTRTSLPAGRQPRKVYPKGSDTIVFHLHEEAWDQSLLAVSKGASEKRRITTCTQINACTAIVARQRRFRIHCRLWTASSFAQVCICPVLTN